MKARQRAQPRAFSLSLSLSPGAAANCETYNAPRAQHENPRYTLDGSPSLLEIKYTPRKPARARVKSNRRGKRRKKSRVCISPFEFPAARKRASVIIKAPAHYRL